MDLKKFEVGHFRIDLEHKEHKEPQRTQRFIFVFLPRKHGIHGITRKIPNKFRAFRAFVAFNLKILVAYFEIKKATKNFKKQTYKNTKKYNDAALFSLCLPVIPTKEESVFFVLLFPN